MYRGLEQTALKSVQNPTAEFDIEQLIPPGGPDSVTVAKKKFKTPDSVRTVTINNIHINYRPNAPQYKLYNQWEKRGTYFSDQLESEIQKKIIAAAIKNTKGQQFKIEGGNYENDTTLIDLPMYPLDIEKDVLDDFTTVIIGRRRSGKTWVMRWMLYHLRHRFKFGIVITGTKLNNFWSQYVPEEFIFDIENIQECMDMVFARQTMLLQRPDLKIDPRMFLILDDVMGDKYKIRFSIALSKCFTNGRHYAISTFITCQDPKGVGPDLRENTDMCVLFRQYSGGRKKTVEEEWMSYLPKNMRQNFFWHNTGYFDPETAELFTEDYDTEDSKVAKMIPQAIAVCQGRGTDCLQKIFKKVIAEDPGVFALGDPKYYKACVTGNYTEIENTDSRWRKIGVKKKASKKNIPISSSESSESTESTD